jgi:sugar phosphate isomerase/epimerase
MRTTSRLTRRNFISITGTAAVSTALLDMENSLMAAAKPRWPVGCRDAHLKVAGERDCWSAMKTLGAECAEVEVRLDLTCPGLFHPERSYTLATADGVAALKEDLAASGCTIAAFMMANRFDERLDDELACTRSVVRASRQLGVNAIRIDVVPRKIDAEHFLPFAIQACKRMCEIAEGTPVRYGLENHGKITNDPVFLEKLFAGVGSEKLGLTLDTANFYWWGHPLDELYAIYDRLAPRVVHTHCKSIKYPDDQRNARREMGWEYGKYCCPIHEGDIDFTRVLATLRRANYRGALCVENESLGRFPESERAEIVRKEIAWLKTLS